MSRRKPGRPALMRQGETTMTSAACSIAVSEISDVPLEQICGYIVLIVSHPDGRDGHELRVIPAAPDWAWVQQWLENAVRDVRKTRR